MKIKITATCIIDSAQFSEPADELIAKFNDRQGEEAFEQLQESSTGNHEKEQFSCVAEEVQ